MMGTVECRLTLDVVHKELFVFVKRNVPLGLLLFTLSLLILLDFKFVRDVNGPTIWPLKVGVANVVVNTIFFHALVERVDHV